MVRVKKWRNSPLADAVVEDALGPQALDEARRRGRSGRRGPRSSCRGSAAGARSAARSATAKMSRQAKAMCCAPAPAMRSMKRPAAEACACEALSGRRRRAVGVGQGAADDQAARVVEVGPRARAPGRGWRGRTGSSSGTRSAATTWATWSIASRPRSGAARAPRRARSRPRRTARARPAPSTK